MNFHKVRMKSKASPFKYEDRKKESVPKVSEKPIMGLKSNKNYILTNAVENILSNPKMQPEEKNWTKKKYYGETPKYIEKIKDHISTEYKMLQSLHENEAEERQKQQYQMSNEEIE